ncbi:hypothetical protein [Maledivibacter halophilus]|nr:hypothetical protein [Maledivibacter halophilus]
MKKVLLFFLILITLIINKNMIFAVEDAGQSIGEEKRVELKKDVNSLLNKRSNLWNQLFSPKSNLVDINKELKEIVEEPLLTYDMEAFSEIKNKHTSMERILKVDVLDISNIRINEKEIIIDIKVEWLMEGFEENYKEKLDYRMNLIKKDEKWKICDYKVI